MSTSARQRQPVYPVLYSVAGFQYCDLLLADAERFARQRKLSLPGSFKLLLQECSHAVSERATLSLQWTEQENPLLSIALDRLTLGRATLYEAMLLNEAPSELESCYKWLEKAIRDLRHAGQQQYLPHGLLTRAWLRSLTGAHTGPDSAQEDLDEARDIAERGPMPLHMADIHLHRARLFGLSRDRPAPYSWESPQHDLSEARRLIEKHGYWRRKEEREDAEAATARL
jgi:hypothetical protein